MINDTDYAVNPGKTILEIIQFSDLNRHKFAKALNISDAELESILSGDKKITNEIAIRLEKLGYPRAEFWNNLQLQYDKIKERI